MQELEKWIPEAAFVTQLMGMEKEIDARYVKKQLDIQEASMVPSKVRTCVCAHTR